MLEIYFEDDNLIPALAPCGNPYIVSAAEGPTHCYNTLKYLYDHPIGERKKVYTNSEVALHLASELSWNPNKEQFEIHLRNDEGFWVHIHTLTNRVLRPGHNIWKLWWSGEFEEGLITKE